MKRGALAGIAISLVAGIGLVIWLVYATRPEAQIRALEAQPVKSPEAPADISTPSTAIDNSKEQIENSLASNESETDIVSTGKRRAARKVALENVPGPEPLPGLTPGAVLQNMRSVIRDYGSQLGGNPFGNNREITAKLNGGNSKQIVFLKEEDGMRVNERGELIDNWGTPFFFHQISGTEMEIRSAGPDRKMWTSDDLVLK